MIGRTISMIGWRATMMNEFGEDQSLMYELI